MRKICNFIIKCSIYGLVLLMPLFWLPWTNEVFEFNKQYLLVFLVALAFMAWLAKMVVVRKKIVLRRTPLDLFVLVYLVIMVLAAVFSIDKTSSWLGFYGRFTDSVVGLLALGVMYFVVVNNIRTKTKIVSKILNLFLISSGLVVLATYFSIFGLWSKISGLPQIMGFSSFNPVSSSLEGLSVFLAAIVVIVAGMLLSGRLSLLRTNPEQARDFRNPQLAESFTRASSGLQNSSRINSGIQIILLLALVVLLVIIDFWAAWVVLGVTMLILLIIAFVTRMFRERVNLLIVPIVLLLMAGIGLTGALTKVKDLSGLTFVRTQLPQELILDYKTAGLVTWQTLEEQPVLGSGPGTFLADFAKFKPADFNQTSFWNIRFDKGPSHLMEMAGTTGILGLLSYLALIGMFLLVGLMGIRKMVRQSSVPLILGCLSLLVAQFVYLQNTVLSFYFWFFMALVIVAWQQIQGKKLKKISFSFKKLPEVGLTLNVVLLILAFALVSLFYLGGRFYLADVKFRQLAATNEELIQNLEKAVNLNKYRENYRRGLSQAYLISAWAEVGKSEQEQDIQVLQAYASGAIQQSRISASLSPNSVAAWENLGAIYRDARGLVGGTLPFALEAFAKALELEPTNPFFNRELCRLNLISEQKDWDKTVAYCQRAIELKSDYLDAHIQLALAYEGKGDLERALKQMESVLDKLKGVSFQRGSALAGAATEIYFQLGRLHFNLNQIEEAIKMFEQAVIITPNYANARYALGLSYQAQGRFQDALIQFQLVNQLVPGNEEVMARIQALSQPSPLGP